MLQQNFSSAATDFWFLTIFEKAEELRNTLLKYLKLEEVAVMDKGGVNVRSRVCECDQSTP